MKDQKDDQRDAQISKDLLKAVEELRTTFEALNARRFLRKYDSWWAETFHWFLRGVTIGLGTAVGATVVVTFLVNFLMQFDWLPMVGDWAVNIAEQIKTRMP